MKQFSIGIQENDILLVNSNSLSIPLADESVHCVITSPPYFGLRVYDTGEWVGGDQACDHIKSAKSNSSGLRNDGREHVARNHRHQNRALTKI